MDQPIKNGVGKRGVDDGAVPFAQGELRADHRRASLVAIVDELKEFTGLNAAKRRQPEVVENEKIGLGKPAEERPVASVQAGKSDVLKKTTETKVANPHSEATAGMAECAGEVGFPHPGGPHDKDVLVTSGEVTGKERPPGCPIKPSSRSELDILRAGGEPQLRFPKEPGKRGVSAVGPLGIHQQTQPLLEGKRARLRAFHLDGKGVGHAPQPEFAQTIKRWLAKHLDHLLAVVVGAAQVFVEKDQSPLGFLRARELHLLKSASQNVLHALKRVGPR